MLSRVADSIYWMARYVERAENVARFIDVNLNLSLDLGPEMARQWAPLVYTTGDHEAFLRPLRRGVAGKRDPLPDLRRGEPQLDPLLPAHGPGERPRRARHDQFADVGRAEQVLSHGPRRPQGPRACWPRRSISSARSSWAARLLEGVAESTMSRGEAWHFRRLATSIERADKTSRILDVKYYLLLPSAADVGTPVDTNQWAALLKSVSALEMYRKQHGRIDAHAGGRVPDPRPRLSPLDALLPDPGRGVAAGDHRQSAGHLSHAGRAASGAACGRSWTMPTSRRSSAAAPRIHRRLPDQA